MTETHHEYGEQPPREHTPPCGDIAMERIRYFNGRYLNARDFRDEQQFHLSRHYLHNRLLHGWGVVCGLRVVPHERPDCRSEYVKLTAGIALDCCGREIIVGKDQYVPVPDQKSWDEYGRQKKPFLCLRYKETEFECVPVLDPDSTCDKIRKENSRIREGYELTWVWLSDDEYGDCGWSSGRSCGEPKHPHPPHDGPQYPEQPKGDPYQPPPKGDPYQPPKVDPYQAGAAPYQPPPQYGQPPPYQPPAQQPPYQPPAPQPPYQQQPPPYASQQPPLPGYPSQQPPQGYPQPPQPQYPQQPPQGYQTPQPQPPYQEPRPYPPSEPHDDPRGCLEPCCPKDHCVLLAWIYVKDGELHIRLRGRRELPPPAEYLTHVCDINWPHGGSMSLAEIRQLRALRVRFDRQLQPASPQEPDRYIGPSGVNACTFVVEYGGRREDLDFVPYPKGTPPHQAENGYAAVYDIDPDADLPGEGYRHLIGHTIFITLHCNFIRDRNGLSVDGEHFGHLPSGDGRQGGIFRSWFHVVE